MKEIWELYQIANEIIKKQCKNKCKHLGDEKIEACYDYINRRLEKNDFKALKNYDSSRGAKESTYLHMLISSRLIDFINSAANKRETSDEISINNSSYLDEETDYLDKIIMDKCFLNLSEKNQTYLKYIMDGSTHAEISQILQVSSSTASRVAQETLKEFEECLNQQGIDTNDRKHSPKSKALKKGLNNDKKN